MSRKEKEKTKKRLRLGALIISCILVFTIVQFVNQYRAVLEIKAEAALLQKQYEGLLAEQKELQDRIDLVQDKTYWEQIARGNFNFIKSNESLVVFATEATEEIPNVVDEDKITDLH